MYYSLIAVCIGLVLDLLIGDPYFLYHPVRVIGKIISITESGLRKLFPKTNRGEYIAGYFLVIIVIFITTAIPVFLLIILYHINTYLYIIVQSIMCYQLLAIKALKTESMKVYHALKKGDIETARVNVSMIVGRDTKELTDIGITKATVETVAENTSDGIIAPLFYMIIGGAGLGFFYKAINTMDSMVGYKNEKYLYFGRVAAKLDDIVNYIPARLSAMLMILGTTFLHFHTKNAWIIFIRDRYNHASPNSAQTESVIAGALGIQLAGDACYFGKIVKKKTIGDNLRETQYEDIKRVNKLLYVSAILGLIIFGLIKLLVIVGINGLLT